MDKTKNKKIAFVCQRYGEEVNGGAEAECCMYAERLAPWYHVEVLTTCAKDHMTWKNEYKPGSEYINGVYVRRYLNEKERDVDTFLKISAIVNSKHRDVTERKWLIEQGPYCPSLLSYLSRHGRDYDAVLFMTYLYYPTVYGINKCSGKNHILIPTAHDEPPIYQRQFNKLFQRADKLIYNAQAEKRFVERRFPFTVTKPSITVGAGVEYPKAVLPNVEDTFGIKDPYICYSGRIDVSKGCGILFDFFKEYKATHPGSKLKLVLTGKAAMEIPQDPDIIPLGFVSEEEKYAVMQDSVAFVIASEFESLSIVVLESMMMGRPVLVNGKSEVLKDHCTLSNAGFYFMNYQEFEGELDYLLSHEDVYRQMCENGKRYVKDNYQWDSIIDKIRWLIELE